jgi:hypothetical protein
MSNRAAEQQIERDRLACSNPVREHSPNRSSIHRSSVIGLGRLPKPRAANRDFSEVARQADVSRANTATTSDTSQHISFKDYSRDLGHAWNRFWFTASLPYTLAVIRILAGGMLFYTHLIWTIDLQAFLGTNSWLTSALIRDIHRDSYAWSHLWYISTPTLLMATHIAALVVLAMLTIGLFTRTTSILAAIITLSYCHRLTGSLFGLDQINAMLAMYLAVGQCGAAFSFDRWLAARSAGQGRGSPATVSTNIAIRLIQIHMCVIYLFGGIGKMRGEMWWDGSALWFAIANYEYQSMNVLWLVRHPWLIALLTHITVFWETFYAFLIWPRYTRPVMLLLAVFVHAGIALFLGMPTFGIAMIIGNLAFIHPETIGRLVDWGKGNR